MRFFGRREPVEERSISIGDPRMPEVFEMAGGRNDARMFVSPASALGMTAVYRAVSLISGAIAGLPLKTYAAGDVRGRVPSYLDDPGRIADFTPFEFFEFVMVSLLLHGNAYLRIVRDGFGAIVALTPISPLLVSVDVVKGVKVYTVQLVNNQTEMLTSDGLVHIRALSRDGVMGLSPISAARQSIGTGLAADKVAARQFGSGLLMGGLVTPTENIPEEEAKQLKDAFQSRAAGHENAGDVAFVNRQLAFSPWTMNAKDAQFIESRSFQVEEVARLFGLPVILLADATKTTSWGAGVAEVIRATQKFTFAGWTSRIEERLARTLPADQFCEFDYDGLLEGSAAEVTANLVAELGAGLLTLPEARRIKNRPPLPPGE